MAARGMSIKIYSTSAEMTTALGRALGARLKGGDVVALDGPLGSGKTCFVRGVAEGMGIDPDQVSSPTYVIVQHYSASHAGSSIAHLDAYRLGSDDDLESIGWDELLESEDIVVLVEWAERIADHLPADVVHIEFAHIGPNERDVLITTPAAMGGRLRSLTQSSAACRTCGDAVAESMPTYPFCSERCRMADLGAWFNETHTITRPIEAEDFDD